MTSKRATDGAIHRPVRVFRHLAVGALAGTVGTAAMDAVLYRRFRRGGGQESGWHWESAEGVTEWSQASAPGQVGRKLLTVLLGHPPPDSWARRTTNAVHWATGISWGAQYGALASVTTRHPWWRAVGLGPTAWLTSYAVLPVIGVYQPIWRYDLKTLGQDLAGNVVFGLATSAAFAALLRGPGPTSGPVAAVGQVSSR